MEEKMCSGQVGKATVEPVAEQVAEQELWAALLQAEGVDYVWQPAETLQEDAVTVADAPQARISYPWNPFTPEAEAFFTAANPTGSIFDEWQESEIADRSQSFFGQLDQLWTANLQATLAERFAARIPHQWLTAIVQQAQQAIANAQTAMSDTSNVLADQLVQCVRDIAPSLADDDFYVLARPLAVQMRNGGMTTTVSSFIAQVPSVEWEQLSDVQRARVGLAVARCAIDQLQPGDAKVD